jgi:hypothetical protein
MNSTKKTLLIRAENLEKVEADSALSEDSMPPLEHVGVSVSSSTSAQAKGQSRKDQSDSEDSMPPLQYVGNSPEPVKDVQQDTTSAKQNATFKVGDVVCLKRGSMTGQVGVITKGRQTEGTRLTVKMRSSGKIVPVNSTDLEKIEINDKDDASDDSLPMLEYLDSTTAAGRSSNTNEGVESDDSMPPLDYVGATPNSDDKIPVESASSTKQSKKTIEKATGDSDSDDSMPPLASAGANASQDTSMLTNSRIQEQHVDDEFKVGDAVTLIGLSKVDLNGKRAVVLTKLGASHPNRITVKLEDSGQKMAVKIENLKHVTVDAEASDDSLPSLDFVGPESEVSPSAADPKGLAKPGEDTLLPPHSDGCSPHSAPHKVQTSESDDSMPPLDNVGSTVSREANVHRKEDKVGQGTSKRSPASQKETAAPTVGSQAFRVGDIVVLKDLNDTRLNGQRATVMSIASRTHGDRCAIRVISTGQKLSVKFEKIEKLYKDSTRPNATASANLLAAKLMGKQETIQPPASLPAAPSSPAMERKVVEQDKKTGLSKQAQPKKITPEALLERMKEASNSNSERLISDVLVEVENAKDLRWGDLLTKKKQIMKKLRAKKRKFEGDGVSGVESELPTAAELDFAERAVPKEIPKVDKRQTGPPPSDSDWQSEKNWVVLPTNASLKDWCASLKLPPEVLQRLQSEDVSSPAELAFVPEEDLRSFVKDLKMGPKGRFLAAVQSMKQK